MISYPEQATFTLLPLDSIVSKLPVRRLSAKGVTRIQESMKRSGFLDNFPLVVTPLEDGSYQLIDGNHRYEAAKSTGLSLLPCVIKADLTESERYKLALESNNAAETVVPSTLVTYAEFIWARLKEKDDREKKKYTQNDIAKMLKWSPGAIGNYAQLDRIDKRAWEIINTTFELPNDEGSDGIVRENFTIVKNDSATSPFTEGLLRSILLLRPPQQVELIAALANPNEKEQISKGRFKTLAEAYKVRNEAKRYAIKQLGGIGYSWHRKICQEIDKGSYDKDWLITDHPKLMKLIEAIRDEWEEKHNVQLIHGDFYEEVKKIGESCIDLIITDPPYNIARDNEFELEGRSNISQDFGAWDKYEDQQFIALFSEWAREWSRILRDQGSGYVFTSDSYISHMRAALENTGLHVKATLVWHKKNPGTQIVQTNFKSSVEYLLFFTKGQGGHTFNWQGENEMHNFIETAICGGGERLVDAKKKVLHPTQKPEQLIKHFMNISSNPGDMVFDGFMGVATTGAAAKKLGRKFIGIEQDKAYFDAAIERLSND